MRHVSGATAAGTLVLCPVRKERVMDTCVTCGSRVRVSTSGEGTSHYEPVEGTEPRFDPEKDTAITTEELAEKATLGGPENLSPVEVGILLSRTIVAEAENKRLREALRMVADHDAMEEGVMCDGECATRMQGIAAKTLEGSE